MISEQAANPGRKAPYAPVSAVRMFFERIRNSAVPQRVDRSYIERLGVAHNNEWALLSTLKFLGVVDEFGTPTAVYRRLQSTTSFRETLRHLVERAYAPLFEVGGLSKSPDELVDYFRVTSSASQARNAARLFRDLCQLCGIGESGQAATQLAEPADQPRVAEPAPRPRAAVVEESSPVPAPELLEAKARLLEKLPAPQPEWSAAEYEAICRHFVDMLRMLGG